MEVNSFYGKVPCVLKSKCFCFDQICLLYNKWNRLRLNEWGASEKLISCFEKELEKNVIATALNNVRPPAQYKGGYPSEVKLSRRPHLARNYKLASFVKSGSHFIFDQMNFDKSWLSLPVSDWKNHEGFKEVESFVRNILVVNDTAERGIKLISDYANCLTKNASERQEILQLVEYHRSKISDDKKSTIKRSYNRDFLM
mgnify:CR=1 FL=1